MKYYVTTKTVPVVFFDDIDTMFAYINENLDNVLTGFVDTGAFTPDMLITQTTSTGARFRIVSLTSTGMLVQSLDNTVPSVGNIFLNPSSNTFSVAGVTSPTADKYSGQLLFIDNKQAFTPTADQTVTLRTVLKF